MNNFQVICGSDFLFLYIFTKIFWKVYENAILNLSYFLVISRYFVMQIFLSHTYLQTFIEKFMKTKYCIENDFEAILLLGFSVLIYSRKFFEKFMKAGILCLKQFKWFLNNFKRFCCSGFPFLYIHENVLNNLWKQKHYI